MVQSASLFVNVHEVPRHEFARLVNTHQGRHAKGFTCWAQFDLAPPCCSVRLAHTDSLREICNGLACCVGKLVHLGITRWPSKSSLSYANVHRPAAIFEDLFWSMTHRFRARSQLGARHTRSVSRTNCCRSIRPPSVCASVCFPGPRSAAPRAASRPTSCWTTTMTCPPTWDQSGHNARRQGPGPVAPQRRVHRGHGPRLQRLPAVRPVDRRRRLFVTRMKDNAVYAVVDERDVPVSPQHPLRRHHSPDRRPGAEQVSASASAHRRVGRGARAGDRAAHQSPRLRGHDRRRHLQGAVADRALLQGAHAEPTGQELRRHDGERAAHPDLRQPGSPCSCSSGCTTSRQRGGRSPILPPCCASTSLPTVICATGLTTPSTHRH